MFCSKCGKEIPDDSIFCPKCGFNLGGNPENGQAHLDESVQISESTHTTPKMDSQTQELIDRLHEKIKAATKKNGYGLFDSYDLRAVADDCFEVKKYDNTDFLANNCLVDYYCHELEPNDYRRTFDSAVECITLALESTPKSQRQALADDYYERLITAVERNIKKLQAEFNSYPTRDLLGFNPRRNFAKEHAARDVVVYISLTELTRIPYLSEKLLDKITPAIIKLYQYGDSYQSCCWGYSKANSNGGTFKWRYFVQLAKSYPEYYKNSAVVNKMLKKDERMIVEAIVEGRLSV